MDSANIFVAQLLSAHLETADPAVFNIIEHVRTQSDPLHHGGQERA